MSWKLWPCPITLDKTSWDCIETQKLVRDEGDSKEDTVVTLKHWVLQWPFSCCGLKVSTGFRNILSCLSHWWDSQESSSSSSIWNCGFSLYQPSGTWLSEMNLCWEQSSQMCYLACCIGKPAKRNMGVPASWNHANRYLSNVHSCQSISSFNRSKVYIFKWMLLGTT